MLQQKSNQNDNRAIFQNNKEDESLIVSSSINEDQSNLNNQSGQSPCLQQTPLDGVIRS